MSKYKLKEFKHKFERITPKTYLNLRNSHYCLGVGRFKNLIANLRFSTQKKGNSKVDGLITKNGKQVYIQRHLNIDQKNKLKNVNYKVPEEGLKKILSLVNKNQIFK